MKSHVVNIAVVLLLWCVAAQAQEKANYSIISDKGKIQINVYKEGLFKAFAHNHLVGAKQFSGVVQFDPNKIDNSSVSLHLETSSLTVEPEGESEKDLQDIQATMSGDKVLDTAKYPAIEFSSTGITTVKPTGDGWTLALAGKLKLHGVEKPVSLPVTVHVEGGQIEAQGEVSLLQTDYGIMPVKVGGGAVTVKNQLKISFDIVATKTTP